AEGDGKQRARRQDALFHRRIAGRDRDHRLLRRPLPLAGALQPASMAVRRRLPRHRRRAGAARPPDLSAPGGDPMNPFRALAALLALALPLQAEPDPADWPPDWPPDWPAVLEAARGQTVYWHAWGGSTTTNAFIAWA